MWQYMLEKIWTLQTTLHYLWQCELKQPVNQFGNQFSGFLLNFKLFYLKTW